MLTKNKIISLIIISICAVLAVTFGCVFGLNSGNSKTDLNTSVEASTYTSGNFKYTYTAGSGTCTIESNYKNSSTLSGEITIPSSVTISGATYTVIGITAASSYSSGAFYSCDDMTSVIIPDTVKTIGAYAFYYCNRLDSVDLGNGVTTIEAYAFCQESFKEIIIPDSVTSIGARAFDSCSLNSITLGSGITTIGSSAFSGCYSLSKVTVSDLNSWYNITFPTYDSNPMCMDADLYVGTERVTNLIVPDTITQIKDYAFYGCTSIINLILHNNLTEIGVRSFGSCSALTKVTFPKSLTTLGEESFYNCDALSRIFFMQESKPTLGASSFGAGNESRKCGFVSQSVLDSVKSSYGTSNYFTVVDFYLCDAVNFESNGGSDCAPVGFLSNDSSTYGILPTPTRANYVFAGWYKNSNLTGVSATAGDTISSSHILYAKWIFNGLNFIVTGTSTSLDNENVEYGGLNIYGLLTPQTGHYISQISFDNSTFYPIEYYEASIYDLPFALNVKYYVSTATNIMQLDIKGVLQSYIEENGAINVYLVTATTPYAELKTSGGASISGVALQVQNISETSTLACVGEARINGYSTLEGLTTVHVSAVASSGYQFVGWTTNEEDDLSAYNNMSVDIPYSLVEGKILIAQFESTNASINDQVDN